MFVHINHIGYELRGPKKAVVRSGSAATRLSFAVVDRNNQSVLSGTVEPLTTVDNWGKSKWYFGEIDFSALKSRGSYRLRVSENNATQSGTGRETGRETSPDAESEREAAYSESFDVEEGLLQRSAISDLVFYFKSQRSSGIFDKQDRSIPFVGDRKDRVDVHGGWYDASGDMSKYLSHLSYANYMNPQQTPLVVWAMLESRRLLESSTDDRLPKQLWRLDEEAAHGADFLVRCLDQSGAFYATIFDRWSKDLSQREICAYRTQAGEKLSTWHAAYRQGGGMAIAALARAAAQGISGDYDVTAYKNAALKGYEHLEANNTAYLPDGAENIIDDYCALLAATEIHALTKDNAVLANARSRMGKLVARLSDGQGYSGWWRAGEKDDRPYFHAADAGLPVLALIRYAEVETDAKLAAIAINAAAKSSRFELSITSEVANPFGYPRQFVKPVDGAAKTAFFFPHKNESGYWWQGENARLASIASARFAFLPLSGDKTFESQLLADGFNNVNWVLGLNPFDACMMQGKGRNTPDYLPAWPNAPGGVCNGITSGFDDETDIALLPEPQASDPYHNWRWGEQWIPHGAWLLLALSRLENLRSRGLA